MIVAYRSHASSASRRPTGKRACRSALGLIRAPWSRASSDAPSSPTTSGYARAVCVRPVICKCVAVCSGTPADACFSLCVCVRECAGACPCAGIFACRCVHHPSTDSAALLLQDSTPFKGTTFEPRQDSDGPCVQKDMKRCGVCQYSILMFEELKKVSTLYRPSPKPASVATPLIYFSFPNTQPSGGTHRHPRGRR